MKHPNLFREEKAKGCKLCGGKLDPEKVADGYPSWKKEYCCSDHYEADNE